MPRFNASTSRSFSCFASSALSFRSLSRSALLFLTGPLYLPSLSLYSCLISHSARLRLLWMGREGGEVGGGQDSVHQLASVSFTLTSFIALSSSLRCISPQQKDSSST